jgi:hypothetical protein
VCKKQASAEEFSPPGFRFPKTENFLCPHVFHAARLKWMVRISKGQKPNDKSHKTSYPLAKRMARI